MAMSADYRSFCSPSSAMVTSPYERVVMWTLWRIACLSLYTYKNEQYVVSLFGFFFVCVFFLFVCLFVFFFSFSWRYIQTSHWKRHFLTEYDYADNIESNLVLNVAFKTKFFATDHIEMCILNENPGSYKLKSYRIVLRQSVANVWRVELSIDR